MNRLFFAALFAGACALPAAAQEYYDIDVDLPQYPEMQPVADSPVYWAPGVDSNYFFYDGLYWDYCCDDHWYASTWYNGPWQLVDPVYVPTYVLWVPVEYYHHHHPFFRDASRGHPPHWGRHWGAQWQQRHNAIYGGRHQPPVRAPLPEYQRNYPRGSYPGTPGMQVVIRNQHYQYRPIEGVSRGHYGNNSFVQQPRDDFVQRPKADFVQRPSGYQK
jgi:hypothetical protein